MRRSYYSTTILLLILSFTTSNAQQHSLESDDSWMVFNRTDKGADFLFGQIILDTWQNQTFYANGKKYRTIIVSDNSNVSDYYGDTSLYPKLYYREENRKIFRYDPNTNSDIQMFEFGCEAGDTVTDGDGNRFEVTEVFDAGTLTAFSTFNKGEKAYRLQGVDNPGLQDIWIDNVGSAKTGIFRMSDMQQGEQSGLIFFSGSEGNYSMAFPKNYMDFKTMPFLKSDMEGIHGNGYFHYDFADDTLVVKGSLRYVYPDNFDMIYTQIHNDTIDVSYQSLQCLGFFESDDMGSNGFCVKIPGFTPGTYTIRTNRFNLLNMPDTVVTCGESISLIGDVNADNIIDISDIVAVINVIVGADSTPGADVNGDGKTDISDIVAIINIIAQ